jgi:hypothetical protein
LEANLTVFEAKGVEIGNYKTALKPKLQTFLYGFVSLNNLLKCVTLAA